jgi:tetratricopeptide (TPR) repeat protein
VLVRLRPGDVPAPAGGLDVAIVVDASAGTEPASLAVARAAVGALLAHLGPDDRAAVWASDTGLRPVLADRPALARVDEAERRRVLAGLAGLDRGGATDLGAVLAEAASRLDPARRGVVVYVGDGVPTVGESTLEALSKRLAKLPRPVRIYGLGVGDRADLGLLAGLSRGGVAERIGDGRGAARAALRVLEHAERPALLGASIDLGPSVERIYPRDLGAIVADESLLVVGRATGAASPTSVVTRGPFAAPVTQHLDVHPIDDRGDLASRWAEGRLAQLLDERVGRAALVDLGMRHGIVTPVTSLYVPTTNELSSEEREELAARKAAARARRAAMAHGDTKESDEAPPTTIAAAPAPAEAAKQDGDRSALLGALERAKGEQARAVAAAPASPAPAKPAYKAAPGDPLAGDFAGAMRAPAAPPAQAAPSAAPANPNANGAPWGRDDSLGTDALSARGNQWGASIGDAFGQGGLGLSGIGEGGGGRGEGLGLGAIGTMGHGAGTGTGQGFGSGHGRLGGDHRSSPPAVRMGQTTVAGSGLPREVIERIVRQNFGRFRLCYEGGLRNNPNLQGRVSTRFVIGRQGSVENVANAGSDLPDASVVACVVRSFAGLSFPVPESGVVTVTFPVMFAPEGDASPKAAPAAAAPVASPIAARTTVTIGVLPRAPRPCGDAASAPFEDRVALWRERVAASAWNPAGLAQIYENALSTCEAPTVRERARLLALMLDALPSPRPRVELWRALAPKAWAADVVYRGLVTRVRTPEEARELHAALGLRTMDPGEIAKAIRKAETPGERVTVLRKLHASWPDDAAVALALSDALEDAGDVAGARALTRELRARPDATPAVRTAIGELFLRLAARAKGDAERAAEEAEARRAFGEIVELAPDDPVARRWLGDLLRAHGWFADALRQYETLAELAPDDTTVALSIAAANEGLGRLEAAVQWTERAGAAGPADAAVGSAATASASRAAFLAWGALAAGTERAAEAKALRSRLARTAVDERRGANGGARVVLTWSHPELHPALFTNALGALMPASEGDVKLGVATAVVPVRAGASVEVRLEAEEAAHTARLGLTAVLTMIAPDGDGGVRLSRRVVTFDGAATARRFDVAAGELAPR